MKQKILVPISCLALFLSYFSAGCLRMDQSIPDKQYFMLDISRHKSTVADAGRGPTLMVRNFFVSPLYDGKAFVYRTSPMRYESDFYNAFFISPGTMLSEETRKWFQKSSLFIVVADPGSVPQPFYVLEGNVSAFYGDYKEKAKPRAILEITFSIFKNASTHNALVFQKDYREAVVLEQGGPKALVMGWSKALERILIALEKELKDKIMDGII